MVFNSNIHGDLKTVSYKNRACKLIFIIVFSWVTFAFSGQAPSSEQPKLILFLSIDQCRADYFERFSSEFTGGLGELFRGGIFFSNADLNYAISETGPTRNTCHRYVSVEERYSRK